MNTDKNYYIELSVVVLCYMSEESIEKFVNQLIKEIQRLNCTYELILVANYEKDSKDTTPIIVSKLGKQYMQIRTCINEKKGGMGWDMRGGLNLAIGKYIAIIDGDGQMPASDIATVYELIKTQKYDLVKTYRTQRYDGVYRKILSDVYNIFFRILFNPIFPIKDINSKPKILTRNAYKSLNLKSNDWFTDAEIMIQSLQNNMRICEIATVFYKNERRASFVKLKTIIEFIVNMINYRFRS